MHLNPANKLLNVTFWIAQLFLTLIFGSSGFLKATSAIADLHSKLPWTTALPDLLVRFIGTCELLGAGVAALTGSSLNCTFPHPLG